MSVPAFCRHSFPIAIVLLGAVFLACRALAQDEELMKVRTTAEAPGIGVSSRAAAVQKAEQEIVRKTLKAALAMEDMTPLNALIQQPGKYVRSTQLIRCDMTDAASKVEVECLVNRKNLLKDAAATLLPRMGRPPSVLVLMAEQFGSTGVLDAARAGAAETALARELRAAKVDVSDSAAVRAGADTDALLAKIQGTQGSPAELGARAGAQAVILGEAVVNEAPMSSTGNVHTLNAGVTIRIYRGSDGSLLDALSQEATVQSANPAEGAVGAIDDACAKLGKEAALYTVLAAIAPVKQDELIVTVEGPGERDRFDQMLRQAENAGGAGSVEEIFYTAEMARLRIKYAGKVSDFVDTILAQDYDGFTLEPRHVVQRDILLKVNAIG
ncbi:MAG: hypothetical protein NTZ09_16155 [Candidatus Hydrogenedentes bacterium]|nr:hypothetical protein [Candidatus Hydrogenedentota bacterium]